MAAEDDVPDLCVPTPYARLVALFGPPARYQLTRWLILRLLGLVYAFAFIGLIAQGPALFGEHGLTPVGTYLEQLAANGLDGWDVPSVLWWGSSDGALAIWAWVGLALSIALLVGYANLPSLLVLWLIYGSFVRVGQLWFSFGWEIQILETTLIAACLVHPWDPRPLGAPAPPRISIVLMRWLAFRIMLGAGLIKLRGDVCWTELTCLEAHFETQPIPNPISALYHQLPGAIHGFGVIVNHVAELVLPWCAFGPRKVRIAAGIGMALFQIMLITSGNLAFLNWLTLIPILACFDDGFLLRLVPRRPRAWLVARQTAAHDRGRRAWVIGVSLFAVVVAIKSVPVLQNFLSSKQAMNRSYDRLALVNTYGAFGSVGDTRHEIVIEGTRDADPETATWLPYELPCKPGNLMRRPCTLGPYHRRLDWLIWFAAMAERPRDPWVIHLVWKLLDGDRTIRELLADDPFDGAAPAWVRIRRFVYHLEPLGSEAWWSRDREQLWLEPVSLTTPGLREAIEPFGWPSPSVR